MSEEDKIEAITNKCYQRHADQIVRTNRGQMKAMRRLFTRWVTFPVGILGALLTWVLLELYDFKGESAKRNEIMDTQTITLLSEGEQRELNDKELEQSIKKLEDKLDKNTQWLIDNMYSKYRGSNPLKEQLKIHP